MARALGCLVLLALLAVAVLFARDYVRRHPQDVPWTRLDLTDPIGAFTLRKLVGLTDEPTRCRALLRLAGLAAEPAPPRRAGPNCGYADGISIAAEGPRDIELEPAPVVTSCPVAAATFVLEQQVIQPAARRYLGTHVTEIHHAGSYACRRISGREVADYSEHATADALDVTGFTLADGRRVTIIDDWQAGGAEAAFLHAVRDGACDLFATVLSPEYNAAHADHLHLDMARRGRMGWGVCS